MKKAKNKFIVHIIESEAGWSSRIDGVKKFATEGAAKGFVTKYNNKYNNKAVTPSWYVIAKYIGEEK